MATENETNQNAGTEAVQSATNSVSDAAATVREKTGAYAEGLRHDAHDLADKAGARLKDAADVGREKAAEGAHMLADATRSAAARFNAEGRIGEYAARTADGLDHFSETLKGSTLDDLAADATNFIRENPLVATGAAALVGFALVRCLKSGASNARDD